MGVRPTTRSQDSAYAHANAHRDCHAFRNRHADSQPDIDCSGYKYSYRDGNGNADQYLNPHSNANSDEHGCANAYRRPLTDTDAYRHADGNSYSCARFHIDAHCNRRDSDAGHTRTHSDSDNCCGHGGVLNEHIHAYRDGSTAPGVE